MKPSKHQVTRALPWKHHVLMSILSKHHVLRHPLYHQNIMSYPIALPSQHHVPINSTIKASYSHHLYHQSIKSQSVTIKESYCANQSYQLNFNHAPTRLQSIMLSSVSPSKSHGPISIFQTTENIPPPNKWNELAKPWFCSHGKRILTIFFQGELNLSLSDKRVSHHLSVQLFFYFSPLSACCISNKIAIVNTTAPQISSHVIFLVQTKSFHD